MSHISMFLDETGDLGFDFLKNNTSKHFVITILVCWNLQAVKGIKTAIKRTLKTKINYKNCSRIQNELKGTKTNLSIKQYFYKQIPKGNWNIDTLIITKDNVDDHLRTPNGKVKLYNYLARILIEKVQFPTTITVVDLIVDRSKSSKEIGDFNTYLKNQLIGKVPLKTSFSFTHLDSNKSPGIQAVDLFSWGVFRKYETKDLSWYNAFKDKIAFEELFFKNKRRRPL